MDDGSVEFMEKAELACVGRSECKMERPDAINTNFRDMCKRTDKHTNTLIRILDWSEPE